AEAAEVDIDETTMRAREPFPACPRCGGLARPNILMFGDWGWDESRTAQQQARLERWLDSWMGAKVAVVECGAGVALPTVRQFCEPLASSCDGTLIRINARECDVPDDGHIGLSMGALAALREIDRLIAQS